MKVKDLLFNELQGPFSKKKNPKLQKLLQDCIQLSHSQHKVGQGVGKVTACLSRLRWAAPPTATL